MSTTAEVVTLPSAERIGQATAVEQQRAIAEVQAAVVVAQQVPRDETSALEKMRSACRRPALAERAFYSFPRGRESVNGATIVLARELGRIWGNVQWGIDEMRRDDVIGESTMKSWAWDLETNTRVSTTFIVPHARDTRAGGRQQLTDLRDIYENNANQGARRMREMIFTVLPGWYVDEAKELCHKTLRDPGDGLDVAQRIVNVVESYAVSFGISEERLVEKIGRPRARWTDIDVAQLKIIGGSIARGEATLDEHFPRHTAAAAAGPGGRVTKEELTGEPTPPAEPAAGPAGGSAPSEPAPRSGQPSTQKQRGEIHRLAGVLGISTKEGERDEYLALLTEIACHPVTSANDLSKTEAGWVIDLWLKKEASAPVEATIEQVWAELYQAAHQRGFESKQAVDQAILEKFAQPLEDLEVTQLREFIASLSFGTEQPR